MEAYYNKLTSFFKNVNLGRMNTHVSNPKFLYFFNNFVPNHKIKKLYDNVIQIKLKTEEELRPDKLKKFSISTLFLLKNPSKYCNFIVAFKPWEKTSEYQQKYLLDINNQSNKNYKYLYNKYKIKYLTLKKLIKLV